MAKCALVAQKNVVLHHSRPDERPAYAGMTGWVGCRIERMLRHRFHPHPNPLSSRERGFWRLVCLVVGPRCGYCLKASMTDPATLWIPAYAGMTD